MDVFHTQLPHVWNFELLVEAWNCELLVEAGIITLDYTLSEKNGRVRDRGYLYKIYLDNLEALFPLSRSYSLA